MPPKMPGVGQVAPKIRLQELYRQSEFGVGKCLIQFWFVVIVALFCYRNLPISKLSKYLALQYHQISLRWK